MFLNKCSIFIYFLGTHLKGGLVERISFGERNEEDPSESSLRTSPTNFPDLDTKSKTLSPVGLLTVGPFGQGQHSVTSASFNMLVKVCCEDL